MKIFKIDKMPVENSYEEISEFSQYDLEDVYKTNAEAGFYWYASGSYEGSGQLLILKDGKWYLHSCSHCSCYGPVEHLELTKPMSSLDEIKSKCSEDLWKEIECLVNLAKEKGYK